MATDLSTRDARDAIITRRQRYLLLAASTMTCLLVTMGGIVCATESGTGCPDWPGCYGRIVPPPQVNAIIEYTHRLIAALTTPLILAAAAVSWRNARSIRWVSRPLAIAIVFLLAVIVFGAFAVLTGLPPVLAALDLGSALVVLTLVLTATVVAFARQAVPDLPDRLSAGGALARLSLSTLAAVFAVHVSGVLVAGKGSLTRCLGWPTWRLLPDDLGGWAQPARLALSAVAGLLILAVFIQAWRTKQRHVALRTAATAAGAAFLAEMILSVVMLTGGTSPLLLVLHVAVATALWVLLVVLAALAGLASAYHFPLSPRPWASVSSEPDHASAHDLYSAMCTVVSPTEPKPRQWYYISTNSTRGNHKHKVIVSAAAILHLARGGGRLFSKMKCEMGINR